VGELFALACSVSCNFRILIGVSRRIANLLFSVASYANLELRPLPSAGITRLHRYYGPIRHPKRPGLSLTGYQLDVTNIHRIGLPVLRLVSLCIHAVATTPAETLGAVVHLPQRHRPSPLHGWVGFRIGLFEACSAFTHVTACILTKSPISDLLHRSVSTALLPLPPLRLLPAGTTSCRTRITLAENLRLFTAHHAKQPRGS